MARGRRKQESQTGMGAFGFGMGEPDLGLLMYPTAAPWPLDRWLNYAAALASAMLDAPQRTYNNLPPVGLGDGYASNSVAISGCRGVLSVDTGLMHDRWPVEQLYGCLRAALPDHHFRVVASWCGKNSNLREQDLQLGDALGAEVVAVRRQHPHASFKLIVSRKRKGLGRV